MKRFMIDVSDYDAEKYAVYRKLGYLQRWEYLASFKTKEECKNYINQFKDLPEYH